MSKPIASARVNFRRSAAAFPCDDVLQSMSAKQVCEFDDFGWRGFLAEDPMRQQLVPLSIFRPNSLKAPRIRPCRGKTGRDGSTAGRLRHRDERQHHTLNGEHNYLLITRVFTVGNREGRATIPLA